MHICSAEPNSFAEIGTFELAAGAIAGSYVKANGDVSGRKNTCPAQTGLAITASGIADHVVISEGVTLKQVTTCPAQALTSGGTVDVTAFANEILDPV